LKNICLPEACGRKGSEERTVCQNEITSWTKGNPAARAEGGRRDRLARAAGLKKKLSRGGEKALSVRGRIWSRLSLKVLLCRGEAGQR